MCEDRSLLSMDGMKEKSSRKAYLQFSHGLDIRTVTRLSRKLCFDWPLLAHHFGYRHDEISKRLEAANPIDMSLILLKEWLRANEENGTEQTKAKLKNGLIAIGREDLAAWMQRSDEVVEEKFEMPSHEKQDHASSQYRKLDRILVEEVAAAIIHLTPNSLMDMLNLSEDQVKTFLPMSVHSYEKSPHLAILCSWKRKMMRNGLGELDCIESLMHVLKKHGEDTAAAILTDGTAVDAMAFGLYQRETISEVSSSVHQDLTVSSMVEVSWGGRIMSGVIQWIGTMKGLEEHGKIAGLELEEFAKVGAGSGKFGDTKYFSCQYGRGLYVPLSRCRPDSRFLTETETYTSKDKMEKEDFGNIECDPIEGYVRPSETVKPEHIGLFKGIQGHSSCYMDVTLYSMFAFSDIFDGILHYEDTTKTETKNVKDALRETIVNPLRSIGVVRADHVLRFQNLLSCLSSWEGFATGEEDPQEFIHVLLGELLNAKPFLRIGQGISAAKESFVYQICTDKKKYLDIPTVEVLLHVSFLKSDLKLSEVPECFIIQLPRDGKKNKLYDWVIPSLEMDINLLIRDSPRSCCMCGHLAFIECRDCTPQLKDDDIIQSFCGDCFYVMHEQKSKQQHQHNPLIMPRRFLNKYMHTVNGVDEDEIPNVAEHLYQKSLMELFSVVCMEKSHYVAFVKTGSGEYAQWVFFDSIADRRGGQHGYYVPEVSHLRDFEALMRREDLKDALKRNKDLPKYLKRLLADACICFYRPIKSGGGIFPKEETRRSKEKPLKEDGDLLGRQLEEMETKYADTVERLEEAQKMMLTLKSKNAELEGELHHTKSNLTSQQEEVERLKKELEDCKKLAHLGNEPVEESAEGSSGDTLSPVGMRESSSLEDFGKFQFHLSSHLTRDIIRDLTLVLAFSPTESEEAEDDKIKFIRLLSRKGLISPTDITKLTNALDEIGHHGVLNAVKNLFDRNPSEAFR